MSMCQTWTRKRPNKPLTKSDWPLVMHSNVSFAICRVSIFVETQYYDMNSVDIVHEVSMSQLIQAQLTQISSSRFCAQIYFIFIYKHTPRLFSIETIPAHWNGTSACRVLVSIKDVNDNGDNTIAMMAMMAISEWCVCSYAPWQRKKNPVARNNAVLNRFSLSVYVSILLPERKLWSTLQLPYILKYIIISCPLQRDNSWNCYRAALCLQRIRYLGFVVAVSQHNPAMLYRGTTKHNYLMNTFIFKICVFLYITILYFIFWDVWHKINTQLTTNKDTFIKIIFIVIVWDLSQPPTYWSGQIHKHSAILVDLDFLR